MVYEVPREDPQPPSSTGAGMAPMMAATSGSGETAPPDGEPVPSPGVNPMAGQSLPEGSLSADSDNPDWNPPAHWTEQAASSMRRATFVGSNSSGEFEIAVTSFPGDVGGELANVNRWRGQLNLDPINQNELEGVLERSEVEGVPVAVTHIDNGDFAMRVAMLPYGGDSWFVRLSGVSAAVEAEVDVLGEFIESIRF